jgi:hypothetical protein
MPFPLADPLPSLLQTVILALAVVVPLLLLVREQVPRRINLPIRSLSFAFDHLLSVPHYLPSVVHCPTHL